MSEEKITIRDHTSIVAARQTGREMAAKLGFGPADQTRLATAISELTRNVVQYAGEGACTLREISDEREVRLQVVVEDWGPGIPDMKKAMEPGFSTGGGLGAGLRGAKRLVHEFDVASQPGYTRVETLMTRLRRSA